ncbi:MAG: hypothetical protein A2Y60_06335 [Chloroflexi bacterium RBG_13_54_9]|nr:MAG: hypothetical protein A2Y60_06335 [Chloroflexi bacterium RBG_13_54_9]
MYLVDRDRCTGCEACVAVCPRGAIELKEDKAIIDQRLCTACGICLEACATGAIYEVEVPTLVPAPTVAANPPRSTIMGTRRAGLATALVSLAPVAMNVFSELAGRWLSAREKQAGVTGVGLGRGAGRRRRWRAGRG